jgi:ketosteroid isomerase-like protein
MKEHDDEQQILKLFEDGDRALIGADAAELSRIFADDYVQYDETGRSFSKQDVIQNQKSGAIRYVAMNSTGRRIRMLSGDIAIVRGSEEDEVERTGQRFTVRYVYMDVVVKRNGRWQIVGSQLAKDTTAERSDEAR